MGEDENKMQQTTMSSHKKRMSTAAPAASRILCSFVPGVGRVILDPSSGKRRKQKRLSREFYLDSSADRVLFQGMTLSQPDDAEHLNQLHCFVRAKLLEVFVLKKEQTGTSTALDTGKKNVVGIRCAHCGPLSTVERGTEVKNTVFFPKSIQDVYRGVSTWQRLHFPFCQHMPESYKAQYKQYKEMDPSRGRKAHWIHSAYQLGLRNIDANRNGISYHPGSAIDYTLEHQTVTTATTNRSSTSEESSLPTSHKEEELSSSSRKKKTTTTSSSGEEQNLLTTEKTAAPNKTTVEAAKAAAASVLEEKMMMRRESGDGGGRSTTKQETVPPPSPPLPFTKKKATVKRIETNTTTRDCFLKIIKANTTNTTMTTKGRSSTTDQIVVVVPPTTPTKKKAKDQSTSPQQLPPSSPGKKTIDMIEAKMTSSGSTSTSHVLPPSPPSTKNTSEMVVAATMTKGTSSQKIPPPPRPFSPTDENTTENTIQTSLSNGKSSPIAAVTTTKEAAAVTTILTLYGSFWKALWKGNLGYVQKYFEQIQVAQEKGRTDLYQEISGTNANITTHITNNRRTGTLLFVSAVNLSNPNNNNTDSTDTDDVDMDGYDDETPLYVASKNGHLRIVEYLLLQPHIDVNNTTTNISRNHNHTNNKKRRPLSAACRQGYVEITKLLLHAGADPTLSDSTGKTPLHEACCHGSVPIARLLLDNSSSDHTTTITTSSTTSSSSSSSSVLLTATDKHGFTPLHFAVWEMDRSGDNSEKGEMVQLLLERGADIDAQDKEGETALHLALLDMDTLQENEHHPEDEGSTSGGGTSSSSYATSPLVELLLARGANKAIRDENGNSFFHKYARNDKLRVVGETLLQGEDCSTLYGSLNCPLQRKNSAGKTPFELAKEYGQNDLVNLFSILSKQKTKQAVLAENNLFEVVFYTETLGFVLSLHGAGAILSAVNNHPRVQVGDVIVAVGESSVVKKSIKYVTDLIKRSSRPLSLTFFRDPQRRQQQQQPQQQHDYHDNVHRHSSLALTAASTDTNHQKKQPAASTVSPPQHIPCVYEEDDLARAVVFHTQQLHMHLFSRASTGNVIVQVVNNEEYKHLIFAGDIVISAGEIPLKNKSIMEVRSLISTLKRPLTLQVIRPSPQEQQEEQYQQQQQQKQRESTVLAKSSSDYKQQEQEQQQQEEQQPREVPYDGNTRSLRDVLNTLSPEILSDSVKSDDENDGDSDSKEEGEEETHSSEHQHMSPAEKRLDAVTTNKPSATATANTNIINAHMLAMESTKALTPTTTTASTLASASALPSVSTAHLNPVQLRILAASQSSSAAYKKKKERKGRDRTCSSSSEGAIVPGISSDAHKGTQSVNNPTVHRIISPRISEPDPQLVTPTALILTNAIVPTSNAPSISTSTSTSTSVRNSEVKIMNAPKIIRNVIVSTSSNDPTTEAGSVDVTNKKDAQNTVPAAVSNDTIKKPEGRTDNLFHNLSVSDASQSVVSDIQNVALTSGLVTTTATTAASAETAKPETACGGQFDTYRDAALTEQEEEEFPLHACVKFGFLDFLEEELQKDSTVVNAVDSHGRTALDLAALTGQLILVARLRQAGGIFQYKNGPRMVALANNRSKEMEKYLKNIRKSVE